MTTQKITLALLMILLAACASKPPAHPHANFGPPNVMPGMAPASGMGHFTGASGWGASGEKFRPASGLSGGFKGF